MQKILGTVRGRPVFVWAQSPGREENSRGKELVGPSGKWFWEEMKRAGFKRRECDVQNVVRCLPADSDHGRLKMRDPSRAEIRCCGLHTDRARGEDRSRVWLVLGKIARDALFARKRPVGPVFQHTTRRVYLLDHPAYFVRGAPASRLERFRGQLEAAREFLDTDDPFPFLRELDIRTVRMGADVETAVKAVLSCGDGRIAVDEESATVDGRTRTLCVGFCPQPGKIWVFVLDHPDNPAAASDRDAVRQGIRALLASDRPKTMHHGSYDDQRFESEFGARARHFDFDTQYGAYMANPTEQSYSLLSVVDRLYPRLSGYKDLTLPEAVPEGMSVLEGRQAGHFRLDRVPLDRLIQYNACDCHVTKKIEHDTAQQVSEPLVRLYTEASAVLETMQGFGPWLDFGHTARVERLYPVRQKKAADRLRELAGNPDLNPNAPRQLAGLLYEKLGLGPRESVSTSKEVLEELMRTNPHEAVSTIQDYREQKTRSDRVLAFRRSAEAHEGRVTTFWWLTGTRTGRLSSGGGGRSDKRNLGNLQNVPSDRHVKNMLVSDPDWREFVRHCLREGVASAMKCFPDLGVFLARDYSQMELRVLAQVAGEPAMIRMFNEGKDIHAAIGALWSNWTFERIQADAKIRRIVKALHFGILYGLRPNGLRATLRGQGLDLSLETVEGYVDAYWQRFPRVTRYRDRMPQMARRDGYVDNIFGFRVPIEVSRGRPERGAFWKNQAMNFPIQGAAHQVLLFALALLRRYPKRYRLIRPQMEIHDALVTVSALRDVPETIEVGRRLLEEDVREASGREFGIDWKVPLVTDLAVGFRYGSLVPFEGGLEATLREAVRCSVRNDRALLRELKTAEPAENSGGSV